jgi:hypothetical protein
MLDLPATLTPRQQRRVELLIDLSRRLAVTMPSVLVTAPTTRPARIAGRLPTRERRRLTLPRPPGLLQLALELPDPRPQPLVLPHKTHHLGPQMLVLVRKQRAPRRQPTKLIHRLRREDLNV